MYKFIYFEKFLYIIMKKVPKNFVFQKPCHNFVAK